MKSSIITAFASTSLFAVSGVQAWGVLGHQTVALVAQSFLLPTTIKKVQSVLNDTSSSYMGNVATWADQFRSQPGQGWSAGLHYIDPLDGPPPESCVIHEMDCPAGGCVLSALANYTARVQDTKLDVADRAQAMKFIIHFMGDIAQPLHTEEWGQGVNNLTVFFKGYKTNMHAAWDTSIPNSMLSLAPTANITMDNSFSLADQLHTAIKSGEYKQNVTSWVHPWHIKARNPYSAENTTEAIATTFAQERTQLV
ncbi:related to nuclease PA3 [Serendipita indica DSM 11827]|uniref:Related to nuclease PA3 n=1 Tax=Serendipita indica (strain DSM 11827) TaxID=1109443 RepID=G4TW28_SERID|nr:related to nuclease PA3 [Serendipita indica DSM 11827]